MSARARVNLHAHVPASLAVRTLVRLLTTVEAVAALAAEPAAMRSALCGAVGALVVVTAYGRRVAVALALLGLGSTEDRPQTHPRSTPDRPHIGLGTGDSRAVRHGLRRPHPWLLRCRGLKEPHGLRRPHMRRRCHGLRRLAQIASYSANSQNTYLPHQRSKTAKLQLGTIYPFLSVCAIHLWIVHRHVVLC